MSTAASLDEENERAYRYDELDWRGKEKACQWYRESSAGDGCAWDAEWRESLKVFEQTVPGLEVRDWSVGAHTYSWVRIAVSEIWMEEMHGWRLYAWVSNRLTHYIPLYAPKCYRAKRRPIKPHLQALALAFGKPVGGESVLRWSKILMEERDCPLTGYCGDESLLQPIRDYLRKPNLSLTLKDLYQECVDRLAEDWRADMEDQESDEYIADILRANDYLFTEEGEHVG